MLKHPITYEDYNGDTVTEEFYFNINKSELVELEVEHQEGMYDWLQNITKTNDRKAILGEFKKIVLLAYGQKSPDGKSFVKNDALREAFSQTAAYNELFMKLVSDSDFAATFVLGIMPKDLAEQIKKDPGSKEILPTPAEATPAPAEPTTES